MLNMLLPIPGQMSSTLTVFLLFTLVILFQVFPKPDPTISSCISYLQGPVTVTAIHRRPVGESHFCPFLFLPVPRVSSLIIVGCYGQMLRYYTGVVVLSLLGAGTVFKLW